MREARSVDESNPTRDVRAVGSTKKLAVAFIGLVAVVWALLVLGALVRANDAGLACPDWPLCFGEVVPQLDMRVAFEYSHRVLAGSVSIVFVLLSWLSWRNPAVEAPTRRLIVVAALLLAVQIVLGALTVWELLASWTVTSHLITGNAVAVGVLLIAMSLRETATPVARGHVPSAVRNAISLGAALLLLQMVLGGLVSSRYAGLSCPEWPTCNAGVWFPTWSGPVGLHLLHRSNAYALVLVFGLVAWLCRGQPRLRALGGLLFGLILTQAAVGIANVMLGLPVEVTGLHSALAAGLVLTTSLALRETFAARGAAC
jgi:heme A synthase